MDEALVDDARVYARDYGVSLEEAIRRLSMQNDTLPSRLERELKRSERETFAGLWLRHEPDYGITVASTEDPEATMRKVAPYVEGTRWEGTVRVRRVEATLVELNAARSEAERTLESLGVPYGSADNIMENRVELYVEGEASARRELRAAGITLPEHVVIIEMVARPSVGDGASQRPGPAPEPTVEGS